MTSLDVICGLGPSIKNPGYTYGLYPGRLPSFGAQASLGGRARLLPGGARRNLMVRISLLARKFRGEEKKKGLQREILGSVLAFAPVFRPGTYLYSLWGGTQAVFWGGAGPGMHSNGIGPVTFFRGTILAWGHTSRWRDTSSDLEGTVRNAHPWRRVCNQQGSQNTSISTLTNSLC